MENNINIRTYHLKWKKYDSVNYKTQKFVLDLLEVKRIIGLGRELKSSCEL